jgi:hypothetical protein
MANKGNYFNASIYICVDLGGCRDLADALVISHDHE